MVNPRRTCRLAFLPLVMACYATPDTAGSQTPAAGDSLRVVLRWGALDVDSTGPGPTREVRWNWNGQILRLDTVARLVDSVTVPSPAPGSPDTLVVALWPLEKGPATLRRMEILDARVLAQRHDGVVPAVLTLDERRRRVPTPPATYTPPPPAPGAAAGVAAATEPKRAEPSPARPSSGQPTLTLDFNDPDNLGVTCGATKACKWPYRKHRYVPTGGVNGSGAINMHWVTGMSIGYSPVWITVPMTPHFKIRYAARQTAGMKSSGSAQKMMRLRSGSGTPIGMLESRRGMFVWDWDKWDVRGTAPKVSGLGPTFNDRQWHTYQIEVDYRNINALSVSIWFDGALAKTAKFNGSAAGNLLNNGPLVISPITEMYSCGQSGCSASINTGDYTVDDFSFTILP